MIIVYLPSFTFIDSDEAIQTTIRSDTLYPSTMHHDQLWSKGCGGHLPHSGGKDSGIFLLP